MLAQPGGMIGLKPYMYDHTLRGRGEDRWVLLAGPERVAVSSLLACGRVHHALVQQQKRTQAALIVESAEAALVHHFCLLVGYGADAMCPYLAFETLSALQEDGRLAANLTKEELRAKYIQVSSLSESACRNFPSLL